MATADKTKDPRTHEYGGVDKSQATGGGGKTGGGGTDSKQKVNSVADNPGVSKEPGFAGANPKSAVAKSGTEASQRATQSNADSGGQTDRRGADASGAASSGGGFFDTIGKLLSPTPVFGNPVVDAIFGAMMPVELTAAMKVGQLMADDVKNVQAQVDAGNVPGATRMDDPGMGRVDKIPGDNNIDRPGGAYSLGNAMSDDRTPNANGMGGGTTSGAGGDGKLQKPPAAASAEAPAAAPAADAVSLAPTANTEIGRLLQAQKAAAAQAGGQNVLTGGQGLDTQAKTVAQRLFGG